MALFTVISIPLVIPFFQVLFSRTPVEAEVPESRLDIIGWLQYYFVQIIEQHGVSRSIVIICLLIVVTFFFKNVFRYLAMYFMVPVRSSVVKDLRCQLFDHHLYTEDDKIKALKRGDLITRMTADVQEVEWSILRFVETIFKSPVIIIGSILLMLQISPSLTLFVFVLMLFTALVIGTLSKTLKKQSLTLQERLSDITAIWEESLDGKLHIDLFGVQKFWRSRFVRSNESYSHTLNRVSWRQDLSSPLSEFLGVSVVVVLLWYGSHLVLDNQLMPETFFAFIFAFYNVIEPSKSFSSAFYSVRKGSAALERIDELLEQKTTYTSSSSLSKIEGIRHNIEFRDVSFSYGQERVLDKVSFSIRVGEKIAIVGPSGAGKSTISMLLLKKLKPTQGQILIDGCAIHDIDTTSWYKHIGMVTQNPFLYNDTIHNNITLGRGGIHQEQMERSLSQSDSAQIISQMDEGLSTNIKDRGSRLSGGEQQRIAIARALLTDPSLIIFDEPTSALDPVSEKKVSEALWRAVKDRTAIIIAHRLSTTQYADRILVLKDGQIVEQGSHQELIRHQGVYADYVDLQTIA